MLKLVCAVALAACTSRVCPVPATSSARSRTEVREDAIAADDQLRKWQAIRADGDRPPPGTTAGALVPELVGYLGSIDPVRRDQIAFEVFVAWIVKAPRLSPAELVELATTLEANLAGPLDAPDGVYLRSFSALVLSLIAKRDLDAPFLDDPGRQRLVAAAVAYAGRETDLRGHTGARGWAHAAAHTADLLKFLARHPALAEVDRMRVLDAVAALVVRRHGAIFHHGEDGRLAVAVLEALRRGVPDAALVAWVERLAAPLREPEPARFDPALYAAQRNARNLLFTVFVQLSVAAAPSDAMQRAFVAIRAAIVD